MVYVTLFTLASTVVLAGDIKEQTTQTQAQIDSYDQQVKQNRKLFVVIIVCAVLILLTVDIIFFIYRCLRSPASFPSPQIDDAIEMQLNPSILDTFPQCPSSCERHVIFGDTCGITIERFIDAETVCDSPCCSYLYHPLCIRKWIVRGLRQECLICRSVIVWRSSVFSLQNIVLGYFIN